jgi:lipopolysaccharide biosynthesis protein
METMRNKESAALIDRFFGASSCSLKWRVKTLIRNLQYLCNLSFYALTQGDKSEKPKIKYSREGALAPNYAKPVCLFCSYDNESIVRQGVYHYLKQLALAGFEVIFISSSDTISDVDLTKLPGYCTRIISRENKGYDFYGWKIGLEQYPQYHLHSGLLLANDSVLGPLFDISDIITRLENFDADIISMTDNFRFYPHLQSYFLYCKKPVILSEVFIRFFDQVKVAGFKTETIRKYEAGFSRLLGQRYRLGALYCLEHVLDQIRYLQRPKDWIDPTIRLWKPLITQFKFPFLKKSLMTKQGLSIQEISLVLAESSSTFDCDMLAEWNAGPTQKASVRSRSI